MDYHGRSKPEDYIELGLKPDGVEAWEDGRRTPRTDDYFEWWYFDGLAADGTTIVITFRDNWPFGTYKRGVILEITPPGAKTISVSKDYDEPGEYSTNNADVRIGTSTLVGDLKQYHIFVDPKETGGTGIDLTLTRNIPSYRPGTGYSAAGEKFFAWLVAVPEGRFTGNIIRDGQQTPIEGSGYHDHNWGNASPGDMLDHWWWGRARVGNYTVIIAALQAKPSTGGKLQPRFIVLDQSGPIVDGYDPDQVRAEFADMVAHPDPAHAGKIYSGVTLIAQDGTKVFFPISNTLLTSVDLLMALPSGKRDLAKTMGMHPWYTRFLSAPTLTLPGGAPLKGDGTLEYIEFK